MLPTFNITFKGDTAWTVETFSYLVWLKYLDLSNVTSGLFPLDVFANNTKLVELR